MADDTLTISVLTDGTIRFRLPDGWGVGQYHCVPAADWPQLERDAALGRAVRYVVGAFEDAATTLRKLSKPLTNENNEADLLCFLADALEQYPPT